MEQFFAELAVLAHFVAMNAGWQIVKIGVRMPLVPAGVCNVDACLIRREHDAVGHGQILVNDVNLAGLRIELVDPVTRNLMRFGQTPRRVGKP